MWVYLAQALSTPSLGVGITSSDQVLSTPSLGVGISMLKHLPSHLLPGRLERLVIGDGKER